MFKVPHGADVAKGVEDNGAATTLTGAGIDFYRLLLLRQALGMQKSGIKYARNMPAATTIARKQLGIKGNLDSLYDQVDAMIQKIQKERAEA
jgi:hypothetical protein